MQILKEISEKNPNVYLEDKKLEIFEEQQTGHLMVLAPKSMRGQRNQVKDISQGPLRRVFPSAKTFKLPPYLHFIILRGF